MIYAVNVKTKEHRPWSASFTPAQYAQDWEVVEADDDGWIPWPGGECPLPYGAGVQVKTKIGIENAGRADEFRWARQSCQGDIIAYRPIIGEPEAPQWDGEGLPPVGAKCEWKARAGGWKAGHIIATFHDRAWLATGDDLKEQVWNLDVVDFRPIRTAEGRAVEEMVALWYAEEQCGMADFARALYRAGYRKEENK